MYICMCLANGDDNPLLTFHLSPSLSLSLDFDFLEISSFVFYDSKYGEREGRGKESCEINIALDAI